MSVIFAERNQAGKLVSATISDVGKALPFREYAFNCEYTVSKTIGNTVKIMLWNMEEINPLQEAKEFVIKEVPHEPEYAGEIPTMRLLPRMIQPFISQAVRL